MSANQAHILDVGKKQYGDSILLKLGDRTVLIDGGNPSSFYSSHPHDSIPDQLKKLVGGPPCHVSLLVVTHAHNDHIGCLPKMVTDGLLTAEWALVADPDLGWGHAVDGEAIDAGQPLEVQAMLAAAREEPMVDASDSEIAEFLLDSQTLRSNYVGMLDALEEAGTQVIRYRGGDEADELLDEFSDIGAILLGPTQLMLLRCAERIEQLGRDFMLFAGDRIARDSSLNDIDIYRHLFESSDVEGIDARGVGAAVNGQSIVLSFGFDGVKFLMTGDMQFTDPGIPGTNNIDTLMSELRQRVSDQAPFDLVKIGHHGSDNSFDAGVLDELNGTVNFVISTGRLSRHHPSSPVLRLLKSKVDEIFWVRTDRNGLCTFDFEGDPPSIEIERGIFTDWRKNYVDTAGTAAARVPETAGVPSPRTPERVQRIAGTRQIKERSASGGRDDVEVVTRVPHRRTRVTVTIDVDPGKGDDDESPEAMPQPPPQPPLHERTAREPLLFVTDRQRLAANIGPGAVDAVLAELQQDGHHLIDVSGHGDSPRQASQRVRDVIASGTSGRGVVVLGGYDVVPSVVLDVLPAELRRRLGTMTGDPDDFIVWSDDIYGDLDGDGVAELPVSRIPDGQSAELVRTALRSRPPQEVASRQGVRNCRRPFADGVFDILSGRGEMLASRPTVYTQVPELCQDFVYLMLHGSYLDATEFHGEGTGGLPAVRIGNIPDVARSVVFTGCCWGALPVDKPAIRASTETVTARTAEDSIALRFLASGASAFVGCTGVHYSPIRPPYRFFGGPIHEAFWRHVVAGVAPAEALYKAKMDYVAGMFHGRDDLIEHAIEYKILRQFVCLGLGW